MIIQLCPPKNTYPPIHFRKIHMTILELSSYFPTIVQWDDSMISWFQFWYTWPHKNIFHIHYLTIIFSEKLPLSKSVVQELNLNQVWVDG